MTAFFDAWHFDGQSAVRRKVEIQTIGRQFYLLEIERRHGPFQFDDLRFQEKKPDVLIYGLDGKDGWRLELFVQNAFAPSRLSTAPLLRS